MSTDLNERKSLIEKACKKIFDGVTGSLTELRELGTPQVSDDFDKIHKRMLVTTQIESDLAYLYRATMGIKREVDLGKAHARQELDDAKQTAFDKPSFKNPVGYTTRTEVDLKLRAQTIEEVYAASVWEKLSIEVQYLVDVIRSYQADANRERRDIDTRLKILSMRF